MGVIIQENRLDGRNGAVEGRLSEPATWSALGRRKGFWYTLFGLLDRPSLGCLRVAKNLHDIVTVPARRSLQV